MQIFGHFYQVVWADSWTLGQNRGQDLLLIVSGWVENMAMPTSKPEKKEPKKPLSVTHPELAKQAVGWDPGLVNSGSGKKLFWECTVGHNWEATVANRVKGSGCGVCANFIIVSGINDLATLYPDIAVQADGWDPAAVGAGSPQKLNWKCSKEHSYKSTVASRTKLKTNCPICSGNQVLAGYNDLATLFPKLAEEAIGWNPKEFTFGSNYKKEWQCKHGHNWIAPINSRAGTNGTGCPFCAGQKPIVGVNDLKTSNPELAKEAFGWDPSTVLVQSNKKKDWKCTKDHVWSTAPAERFRGHGCPICSGQRILKGFNDLKTLMPELSLEADGWDPSEVGPGSTKKLSWKCSEGHRWIALVYSRKNGNGCPVCAGKTILVGFNDLASRSPKLAAEAFGWDPTEVTTGSGKSKKWICVNGHKWMAPISRRFNGTGCPFCAGQKVFSGFNDLATLKPNIAKQAYEWDPTTTTVSSDRIEKWKCPLGHIYTASVKDRNKGTQCSVCAGKQIIVGINDLTTTEPNVAKEAYGWDPATVTRGSANKKQKWKCPLGHIYEATPAARTRKDGKNSGCGICNGKTIQVGFNDLSFTNPELARQANGWDPHTVTAGSGKTLSWKCAEGHEWKAVVSSRKISGCPTCHLGGYDPNQDGYLYFLQHSNWEMFQIGITNFPDQRLNNHKKLGWEVLEIRGPMDGHLTQQWETAILRMLKKKGADLSNEKIAGKFDGYSEAWTKAKFPVDSIKELMRLTDEFEESKLGD